MTDLSVADRMPLLLNPWVIKMAKRFGRNQKRKLLQTISALEKELDYVKRERDEHHSLYSALSHEIEEVFGRHNALLKPPFKGTSTGTPPQQMYLAQPGSTYATLFALQIDMEKGIDPLSLRKSLHFLVQFGDRRVYFSTHEGMRNIPISHLIEIISEDIARLLKLEKQNGSV